MGDCKDVSCGRLYDYIPQFSGLCSFRILCNRSYVCQCNHVYFLNVSVTDCVLTYALNTGLSQSLEMCSWYKRINNEI